MNTIITLSILTVVGFLAGWLLNKYSYYADGLVFTSYVIGIISAIALICFLCSLINIDKRIDAFCYKYDAIVLMVDTYDGKDYGNMNSLVSEVVEMNETIAEHKAHYDSKWTGLWHSERIANLEPISFNRARPALE